MSTWVCSDEPSNGYCGCGNTEYPAPSNAFSFKRCAFGRFYVPLMYVTSVGCC